MKNVIFFLSIICSSLIAHDNSTAITVLKNQPDSIEEYTNKKLYLRPDRIILTPQGFALNDFDSTIFLPKLQIGMSGKVNFVQLVVT